VLNFVLYTLIILCSIFLICLVLIQRGRGGGLAGAFGGAGGSSAFGTRAGDVFTRITIVAASIWIALNMLLVILANRTQADNSAFAPPGAAEKSGLDLPAPAATGGDDGVKGIDDILPPALDSLPGAPPRGPISAPAPAPAEIPAPAPAETPAAAETPKN
jgi:preprotein translocase subunit SecG